MSRILVAFCLVIVCAAQSRADSVKWFTDPATKNVYPIRIVIDGQTKIDCRVEASMDKGDKVIFLIRKAAGKGEKPNPWIEVPSGPDPNNKGVFGALFVPPSTGNYEIMAIITEKDGKIKRKDGKITNEKTDIKIVPIITVTPKGL